MTAGPAATAAVPSAPAAATAVVEAHALGRTFAGRRAVDGVTFALREGECLALFGPNGAGKTTLLRMLGGLLRPTSGRATLGGAALPGDAAIRARVGLVSHQSLLYAALTARENVEFAARLYGVRDPVGAARAALARMRVLDRAESPVRALSRGLQQRVSIARATVHAPSVVLLDEPYTGLDEAGAAALSALLAQLLAGGASLVLVTHNLAEGLAVATHAAVMREGRFARFDRRAQIDAVAYAAGYRALAGAGASHEGGIDAGRPRA